MMTAGTKNIRARVNSTTSDISLTRKQVHPPANDWLTLTQTLPLSDQQLQAVTNVTSPLQAWERSPFLQALGQLFAGRSEVGDGELGRALRELQREHFTPSLLHSPGPSHKAKSS